MTKQTFLTATNNTLQYSGYNFLITSGSQKNDAKVSIIDSKTGDVVPVASCVLSSGQAIIHSDHLDMLIAGYEKNVAEVKKDKVGRTNPVEVVRYIRPLDMNCGGKSNMYGVTLIFSLDYEARSIDVLLSVCNGDNFDKSIGLRLARQGDIGVFNAPMPYDIYSCTSEDSLVQWFIERFPTEPKYRQTRVCMNRATSRLINKFYEASQHIAQNIGDVYIIDHTELMQ